MKKTKLIVSLIFHVFRYAIIIYTFLTIIYLLEVIIGVEFANVGQGFNVTKYAYLLINVGFIFRLILESYYGVESLDLKTIKDIYKDIIDQ